MAPIASTQPEAEQTAARAASISDALAVARDGIALREAGRLAEAADLFRRLTIEHPSKPYGWQELGILSAQQGERAQATEFFRQAIVVASGDLLPRLHLAHHLLEHDGLPEAERVLATFPLDGADHSKVTQNREFLRYLARWPQWRMLRMVNTYEGSAAFLNVSQVAAAAFQALQQSRPFSLVRIGDGEGAWLRMRADQEVDFSTLFSENRREFLRIWFGDSTLHRNELFQRAADQVQTSYTGADILGVPYSLRLVHEYRSRSMRGVPSVANSVRFVDELLRASTSALCSQDIHVELQQGGFFRRFLGRAGRVRIITCHRELRWLIQQRTGARVEETLLVPEEKASSPVLGSNGLCAAHFPTAYEQTIQALRARWQHETVWLVSAGFLGKLYCAEIRARGGIALDIGSITDGWLGKATRPTLRPLEQFRL